jgi:hypothetical protein
MYLIVSFFLIFLMAFIGILSEWITEYNYIQESIIKHKEINEKCKNDPITKKLFWDNCRESENIVNSVIYPFVQPIRKMFISVMEGGGILFFISFIMQLFGITNINYIILALFCILIYIYKTRSSVMNQSPIIFFDPRQFITQKQRNEDLELIPHEREFHGVNTFLERSSKRKFV